MCAEHVPNPAEGPAKQSHAQSAPLLITPQMLAPTEGKERRIDFERGISYTPPLGLLLIGACVAVFIWQIVTGALESEQAIVATGALHRRSVMAGEIWRLVTAMFLHGGIDHLLGNCAVLYVLAMACEHAFGVFKTGLVYLVSGVAGSALSVVMSPGPSVGASGAIFGLSGAIVVFLHKHHKLFFLRDKRIASVLLIWAIYTIVTGFLSPQIDNFAHIGGFLAGASAGALVPMRSRPELKAAFDMLRSQQAPTPSSR